MGGSQLAATALGKPMPGKSRSPFSQYAAAWKAAIPVSASRRALTGNAAILAAGRRPGRHLAASRSSALAKTPRTPKTPRTTPAWRFALGTGLLALRASQWPCAQAHPATVLVVLGVPGVLARPPPNEIPCGRPANFLWHSPPAAWKAAIPVSASRKLR